MGKLKAIEEFCKGATDEGDLGPYRTEFMRDRDRILYSKPFRRLSKKTQIFLPASENHVRTRLTRTLEVAQIATTTSKALNLDRDLTEAIALGHDLGHTPFGHSGERTLNQFLFNCDDLGGLAVNIDENEKGFKHNLQSVRIVSELETLYENLVGLNLTNFTLWGIQNHTDTVWKYCEYASTDNSKNFVCNFHKSRKAIECNAIGKELSFYNKYKDKYLQKGSSIPAWSFEAYVVKWADEIAQRHHDIEDGIIAKVIDKDELLSVIEEYLKPFFDDKEKAFFDNIDSKTDDFVQKVSKILVGCLNRNLIENSINNLNRFADHYSIKNQEDFKRVYPTINLISEVSDSKGLLKNADIISYLPDLKMAEKKLQDYLKNRVLNSYEVQRMDGKARFILRQLAKAYLTNPQQLPNSFIKRLFYEIHPDQEKKIGDIRDWLSKTYYSQEKQIKQVLLRIICDFLSGMTDEFSLIEHQRLYSSSDYIDLRHY